MNASDDIACAILAAGTSRRLGHPKQLVSWRGRPLIRHMADIALGTRCDAVAVILGAHAESIRDALSGLPVERLDNDLWAEGMASSVRAAASWAEGRGADALLLMLVDQVLLTTVHLDRLIHASAEGRFIAASQYHKLLGVPALFPRSSYPALSALRGDRGARDLLRDVATGVCGGVPAPIVAVPWEGGASDMDTQADIHRHQHDNGADGAGEQVLRTRRGQG